MFDITLIPELSTVLAVPHVVQNGTWDTMVYVCNPNGSETTIDLTFVKSDGTVVTSKEYTLPVNGSGKYPLSNLLGGSTYSSGSVEITASQGVAAFALYQNLKKGGHSYAGISAVEPEEPPAPLTEDAILGNFKFVYTIISTWTDRITINQKDTDKTSEGTYFYFGYDADYPSVTIAAGAWYPSLSQYIVVCMPTYSSPYCDSYAFSINPDNTLTGFHMISSDSGATWGNQHSFIISQSYKTPLGSWIRSSMESENDTLGIDEVFERKISEDQETRLQRTESSSSTDVDIISKLHELNTMIENLR